MKVNMGKSHRIVWEDGEAYWEKFERVEMPEAFLAGMLSARIPDMILPALAKDCYIGISDGAPVLYLITDTVSFSSNRFLFSQDPDNPEVLRAIPDLNTSRNGITFENAVFKGRDGLSFLYMFNLEAGNVELVAFDRDNLTDTKVYRVPFPNIYNTMQVCTGEVDTPSVTYAWSHGLSAYVKQWKRAWDASAFNTDLYTHNKGSIDKCLIFDKHGVSRQDYEWRDALTVVTEPESVLSRAKLLFGVLNDIEENTYDADKGIMAVITGGGDEA